MKLPNIIKFVISLIKGKVNRNNHARYLAGFFYMVLLVLFKFDGKSKVGMSKYEKL